MSTKKKILVVEDDANLRELVKSRLENEGFEVVTAADGFQAVVTARQADLDLVILDLILPKMDGYSVCQLLKSSGMARTPIVMLSARSSAEDVRRGLDMGASAFIPKPYKAAVLIGKVRELLFPQQPAKKKEQEATPKPTPAVVVETPPVPDKTKVERESAERRTREETEAKARADAERRRQEEARKPAPPRTKEEAEAEARAEAERKELEEEERRLC